MEPRCLTCFQSKWEEKNFWFPSSILSYHFRGSGGCKQSKNCFWGLKTPEAGFSHPFDHSWLSHTKNFSIHVVPALTRPQRFQRMNGKAKTAPRPTQGNKGWEELGGIFFTLLGYLAFTGNKKTVLPNGSCQLFPQPTKFHGSNREKISHSSRNPLPHFIWVPTGIAKHRILSTKYNGTVAYINTFNTS